MTIKSKICLLLLIISIVATLAHLPYFLKGQAPKGTQLEKDKSIHDLISDFDASDVKIERSYFDQLIKVDDEVFGFHGDEPGNSLEFLETSITLTREGHYQKGANTISNEEYHRRRLSGLKRILPPASLAEYHKSKMDFAEHCLSARSNSIEVGVKTVSIPSAYKPKMTRIRQGNSFLSLDDYGGVLFNRCLAYKWAEECLSHLGDSLVIAKWNLRAYYDIPYKKFDSLSAYISFHNMRLSAGGKMLIIGFPYFEAYKRKNGDWILSTKAIYFCDKWRKEFNLEWYLIEMKFSGENKAVSELEAVDNAVE